MDKIPFLSRSNNHNPYAQGSQTSLSQQAPVYPQRNTVPGVGFFITNAPDETFVMDNVAAVSPGLFKDGQTVIIDRKCVLTVRYAFIYKYASSMRSNVYILKEYL